MADRFLIVSDLDGTLIGNAAALEELSEWLAPRRGDLRIAYSSGRPPASQRVSVAEERLPEPDALIGNVGTRIEDFASSEPIAGWPKLSGPWEPTVVRRIMSEVPGIELQPEKFNSEHKVSYYWHDATPAQLDDLQSRLEAAGQAVRIVYSSSRDLDILPAGIDKGAAAVFLAKHWEVPRERVIVCGDTANDLSMFEQGFRGIVVGNALAELRALCSPNVYHAHGQFAAGVEEGLRYWFEQSTVGAD